MGKNQYFYFLSRFLKIPKEKLWPLIDSIQRELLKKGLIDNTLNEYIINTPELLNKRVVQDIDKSIEEYEKNEPKEPVVMKDPTILKEIESNKYIEAEKKIVQNATYYEKPSDGSKAQNLLGGEMSIKVN